MMRRRGLAPCCILHKRMISIDLDEQNITTYDGLERCIKQSQSYDDGNESSASRSITTDSSLFDDDASSSNSSNTSTSNNTDFRSSSLLSSDLTAAIMKREPEMCEFSAIPSPQSPHTCVKVKVTKYLDVVEAMKVKFSKLLLGEDMTGGSNGVSTALALSNAILNLSTSVFGELWKLEPLSEEKKRIWQQEMEWFLSPTNYMVELVPSTQNGDNGCIYEIMTPKARPDVQMNLPALQKLDIMLIETLDSMVDTEFWYSEVGSSRAEGGSKRWWLPSPQVPMRGLCDGERKKLMDSGKLVNQILKASKAINENVLLEMTVPAFIRDAIPKSAKANLGEDLYQILTRERVSTFDDMVESLNLKTEHNALETINRLEAAILVWKEKMAEEADCIPMSWSSFIKHPKTFEVVDGINVSLNHAEALLRKIRTRYPNLPHTFLDMMKIQYGKDIGHAILEAYSRVLGNLAYTILARIGAVLQEDILSNPNSPAKGLHLPSGTTEGTTGATTTSPCVRRHSLIDQMNKHAAFSSCGTNASDLEIEEEINSTSGSITSSTPSRTRVWCLSRKVSTL